MKNILKYFMIGSLSVFAAASCSFTDLEPTDMVGPETAFKNVENVHKATVGLYGMMSLRTKLGAVEYIADDCTQGGDSGGAGTDLYGLVYTATSGDVQTIWSHYYGIINQANRILYYGPQVTPADEAEQESLDLSLGTAYLFRAYAHFELLCFFSDFQNDEAAGIPYVSHYHVVGNPGRDKVGECFDYIMTDLERAYDLINVTAPDITADNSSATSTAYVSKTLVDAIRAKVSLYHKQYLHAYIYASNVLDNIGIATKDQVEGLWLDENNAGVIFKLSRPSGTATIGTLFVGGDYSSVFYPSDELRAQFTEDDVRTPVFFREGRDRSGNPAWMVTKWFGKESEIGRCDEKMFRAEEMLLIAAEASMEQGNLTEAGELLNSLKRERIDGYSDVTYGSESQLRNDIISERRRELVWEGHRFFDARRYGITMSRGSKTITPDDIHLIFPIPQAEIDANEALTDADQNYGY